MRRSLGDWLDKFRAMQKSWWDDWVARRNTDTTSIEEPVVEEPEIVEDTFDFTFTKSTNSRGRDIITTEFTVTDSLIDNTYTGGDDLFLEISGGWEDHRGRFRFMSQRMSIDDFGPVDGSKDYAVGNTRIAKIFDNSDEVTVTLTNGLGADADIFFTEVFAANDVVDILA